MSWTLVLNIYITFRLQDIANSLRKKLRESEAAAEVETARLHEEISRLHQNIGDIEKKANHFANINDRRYQQVWNLRQETANKLLAKVSFLIFLLCHWFCVKF